MVFVSHRKDVFFFSAIARNSLTVTCPGLDQPMAAGSGAVVSRNFCTFSG
jgi:hypothetical protein